jgi:hypothetical protein
VLAPIEAFQPFIANPNPRNSASLAGLSRDPPRALMTQLPQFRKEMSEKECLAMASPRVG